ncbi:MAG: DNA methyltransferase [Bacteroidales bacterium]|nr:DNA methyltransferase [Bacteroidales bacterium]
MKVLKQDSLEFLKQLKDYQADIVFADPPYALGSEVIIRQDGKVDYAKANDFMNKWEMPTGDYWEKWFIEAYRTLKYGGYLLMYGMDRQLLLFKYYASLAGFQEQQSIYWYYISNFPKATDLSKMIDKRGGGEFDTNHIAAAIKEARLKRKMTVSECDKLFCNSSTNWTWFEGRKSGVRPPTYDTFMKIANEWQELLPLAEAVKEAEREILSTYKRTENSGGTPLQGKREVIDLDITAPSTDLAKKYDGYKYSVAPLKQTCETIMVFKKPNKTGSVLHDTLAMENGDETITCSALNIDGNRVGTNDKWEVKEKKHTNAHEGYQRKNKSMFTDKEPSAMHENGRYPAQTFIDSQVAEKLDRQSGVSKSSVGSFEAKKYDDNNTATNFTRGDFNGFGDTGGCSKILHKCDYEELDFDLFIYEPKVSGGERNNGLDEMEEKRVATLQGADRNGELDDVSERFRTSPSANNHPTLKPIDLNDKILKLFKTPNDQVIVYPFAGSGSEIIGGLKANFQNWYACEINQDYVDIANARIEHYKENEYIQLSLL